MLMSLSSLASKTSRHSRHSTNSASSSRLTICTRGCLHGGLVLRGDENGFEVINPEASPSAESTEGRIRENSRYFSPPWPLVKCFVFDSRREVGWVRGTGRNRRLAGRVCGNPTKIIATGKPLNPQRLPLDVQLVPLPAGACAISPDGRKMNYDGKGRNSIS